MASYRQTLYMDVPNDLQRRVYQHKNKINPGSFTSRYNINGLVYYETFTDIQDALAREKQLKSFRREKKVALLVSENLNWQDLSLEWE